MIAVIAFSIAYLFFIATVICLNRAKSSKLRELSKQKYFCARYARKALIRAERLLHTSQLGLFLSAVAAGLSFAIRFDPLLDHRDIQILSYAIPADFKLIAFWAILGLFLLISFLAINATRVLALSRPHRTLCYLSVPLLLFSKLLDPISDTVSAGAAKIARWFGITPTPEREQFASADEINELVEKSTKAGKIEEDEGEMIKQVFTFKYTLVREVMTPRKSVIYVMKDITLEQLVKLMKVEQFSRVLVCDQSLDQVLGVLHTKDLIPFVGKKIDNFSVTKYIRPAFFVPNTKNVDQLLEEFKTSGRHFAVVLDEHAAVDGVVTLEDLIEELVGEIFDEYDDLIDSSATISTESGDLIIDAGMNIEDFNDSQQLQLPEGSYDTVAGFIISQLGAIPHQGQQFEYSNYIIHIDEMQENSIKRVRISHKNKHLAAA